MKLQILTIFALFIFAGCSTSPPTAEPKRLVETNSPDNTTKKTEGQDLKIKGNRKSRIYHLPGCPNYSDIAEKNVVPFKTTEEAESKGFRMAKNCR